MEEGPADYASVNHHAGVTSWAGQKRRAPIAVNQLVCAACELYDLLTDYTFPSRQLFLVCCYSVASIHDVIGWGSRVTATLE